MLKDAIKIDLVGAFRRLRGHTLPHCFGQEASDCGAAALATLLRCHGCKVTTLQIARQLAIDIQGVDLAALRDAAIDFGFVASCGKVQDTKLFQLPVPFIAHFEETSQGHFVVVHNVSSNRLLIFDPMLGIQSISQSDFETKWSGYVLLVKRASKSASTPVRDSLLKDFFLFARLDIHFVIAAAISSTLAMTINLSVSVFIRKLMNEAIVEKRIEGALGSAIAFFLLAKVGIAVVKRLIVAEYGRSIERKLTWDYLSELLHRPLAFFERSSMGDLLNRFNDIMVLRATVSTSALSTIVDLAVILSSLVILLSFDYICAMYLALLTLFALLIGYFAGYDASIRHRRARHLAKRLVENIIQLLVAVRVVKSLQIEADMERTIHSAYRESERATVSKEHWNIATTGSLSALMALVTIYLLNHGRILISAHRLTISNLILEYSIAGILWGSVETAVSTLMNIQEALVSFQKINSVSDEEVDDIRCEANHQVDNHARTKSFVDCNLLHNNSNLKQEQAILKCCGVAFSYNGRDNLLTNVTLDVYQGETIGIIGSTGSGKTTIASLLAGLYLPSKGTIELDGEVIGSHVSKLRKNVGVVFQDGGLIAGTIWDNIILGNKDATEVEVTQAATAAQANSFITNFRRGYLHQVGVSGSLLSTGQRQRIGIARALLSAKPILILDEVTSGLDVATEALLFDEIKRLRKGLTTILITHRLSLARKFDRCFIVDCGRICEQGAHDELVSLNGRYAALCSYGSVNVAGRA